MLTTEFELLAFLDQHQLPYQYTAHPPVYTCEEAERLRPDSLAESAVSTKNLFLCDKKARRFYLAVTDCEAKLDLKWLAKVVGEPKLRFASERNLERLLGVGRGAVTVLGLVNDSEQQVQLWIDAQVWQGAFFLCHPLVNTATVELSKESLERFFALSGHVVHLFNDAGFAAAGSGDDSV